jgi:hypothetical protein
MVHTTVLDWLVLVRSSNCLVHTRTTYLCKLYTAVVCGCSSSRSVACSVLIDLYTHVVRRPTAELSLH